MRKRMRGCCQNSVAKTALNICLVVNDPSVSMLCKEFAADSQVKDAGRCQYEVEDEILSQAGLVISLFVVSRLAKHYRIGTTIPISQSILICSKSLWANFFECDRVRAGGSTCACIASLRLCPHDPNEPLARHGLGFARYNRRSTRYPEVHYATFFPCGLASRALQWSGSLIPIVFVFIEKEF